MEKLVKDLQFIQDRGIGTILADKNDKSVTIIPHDYQVSDDYGYGGSKLHLCALSNPKWNDVEIPKDVTLVLKGWCFSTKTDVMGTDVWCLNWLKERFSEIIDHMDHIETEFVVVQ